MLDIELVSLVERIKELSKGRYISTAESCTGGLLAAYLTSIPGSSDYFTCGIVCYSNEAKIKLLNVREETLKKYGAVSPQVAREMVLGIYIGNSRDVGETGNGKKVSKKKANCDIAISITGIAGPSGGAPGKPVGTVCFGLAIGEEIYDYSYCFTGDRDLVRLKSCRAALQIICRALGK